ncbi:Mitochondrial import inner membrane translocase subunit Tim8 [Zea mays]|uniref:Mitochondrial import inner membrane translocase subunit n=2 Tax=Zea mays TaxID=4577 RepID=A0A1D6KKB2_MAIZE|nr:Mitochondrial import inner membrane translocase subunit Tim8 [Zea mays]
MDNPEMQRFIQLVNRDALLARARCCCYHKEQQKAMMNEMVGKLTSACWDKCITSAPGSKFSSGESTCLTNCAQRFLDMSVLIAKRFEMQ